MIIDTCFNPGLTKHLFGNIENTVQNDIADWYQYQTGFR